MYLFSNMFLQTKDRYCLLIFYKSFCVFFREARTLFWPKTGYLELTFWSQLVNKSIIHQILNIKMVQSSLFVKEVGT